MVCFVVFGGLGGPGGGFSDSRSNATRSGSSSATNPMSEFENTYLKTNLRFFDSTS